MWRDRRERVLDEVRRGWGGLGGNHGICEVGEKGLGCGRGNCEVGEENTAVVSVSDGQYIVRDVIVHT